MGNLAQAIHDEAAGRVPAAPVADPAQLLTGPGLLAIFAKVEAAVAALELLARGARIVRVAGVPNDAADGENGDLGLNTTNADLYAKDAGHWTLLFNLKGPNGKDAQGAAGLSAYQVALANGFVGTEAQWLASLGRAGADGKNAYQLAVAGGFVGTQAQWLESLKVQGDPGQRGNVMRWESYAPTTEDGQAGDLWIHSISETQCAFYKCLGPPQLAGTNWQLRFRSPATAGATDPGTTPGAGLPSQSGQAGKVLGTDGTTASWVTPTGRALPEQSATTVGKVLKSGGTPNSEYWGTDLTGDGNGGTTTPLYTELGQQTDGAPTVKLLTNELAKKVDKVTGKGLSTNDYTTADKEKLGGLPANPVRKVNGQSPDSSGNLTISFAGQTDTEFHASNDGTYGFTDFRLIQVMTLAGVELGMNCAAWQAQLLNQDGTAYAPVRNTMDALNADIVAAAPTSGAKKYVRHSPTQTLSSEVAHAVFTYTPAT